MGKEQPDYAIFDDFNGLEIIECHVDNNYKLNEKAKFCENINYDSDTNPDNQLIDICKKFVTLLNALMTNCSNKVVEMNKRKYPEYMNFWLNYKLSSSAYNKTQKSKFYQQLPYMYSDHEAENILKTKMDIIDDKYFNNMSILYKLYKMLYSESEEEYQKCDNFMQDFKKIYNEGLIKCYLDGDTNLGKGLESFKQIYEENRLKKMPQCNGKYLPPLPKLSLVNNTDNNLRTSNIATELLQYNYEYSMDNLPKINDNYV